MRTKTISNAKLIVTIKSKKKENKIEIVSVFDNRENNFWSNDRMLERGINNFLNLDDMKETLNWNLNGDSSKYQFKWGQSTRLESEGRAYIFD